MCRDLVKYLKEARLKKVHSASQGDAVCISSASKDDLQGAMALLRGHDFGVELKFENFRTNWRGRRREAPPREGSGLRVRPDPSQ